jgi:hypothetical protein
VAEKRYRRVSRGMSGMKVTVDKALLEKIKLGCINLKTEETQ